MTLSRLDKEFRHEGVSYLDYKQVEMDRVLTAFLPRLWWDGQRSVIARSRDLTVEDFVETIEEHPELFEGFDPAVTSAGWRPICWTWSAAASRARRWPGCGRCTGSPTGSGTPAGPGRTARTSSFTRCSATRPRTPAGSR